MKKITTLPKALYKETLRLIDARKYSTTQKGNSNKWNKYSFDRYRCIFIHIPKTSGISISKSLFGDYGISHMTVKDAYALYTPLTFYRYFKFTIVRNPWDRLYSAFMFLKAGGMHKYDKRWAELNLMHCPDFETFVKDCLTLKIIQSKVHFMPQINFLLDRKDKIRVNYVGYYEELEKAFNFIKSKVNPNAQLVKLNITKNKKHYKNAYTPRMVNIVRKHYRRDINIFNYNF